MNRRELIAGAAALLPLAAIRQAVAQGATEVVIGAIYPMSGNNAQIGLDTKHVYETALDLINNINDLRLSTARGNGLAGLGGAKLRLVFADHQNDPQKGRAEAERLITQDKVVAVIGCYQSAVSATVSVACERYGVPFMCAESSSPSLHRRNLKYFFRASPHDEGFTLGMFDLMDAQKRRGHRIETIAIFAEDTIFGTDSANVQRKLAAERGYKIAVDIKYKASSPSLTAEVQQLKSANADVLMPSSYTTDAILLIKTMADLGYRPRNILAQAAGFSEKALYDAVGDKLRGVVTRASASLDLAPKRPAITPVNQRYRARSGKDLNDNTARQFMSLLVLADAIDRAKSTDGEKIRSALTATDIPGDQTIMPWSRVKFGEDGQNAFADVVLLQWVGDKFVTIFPTEVAIAEPIWPMSS
jgi:branched-chain amino acid transport system substrate-binding protein